MNLSISSRIISLLVTFILRVLEPLSKNFKSHGKTSSINIPNVHSTNIRMVVPLSFGKNKALE